MREIAERVLFAETLEEKLFLGPETAVDDSPGNPIMLPPAPGRPHELRMRGNGTRVDFPGTSQLDDDSERGKLLHFLANHELLAAELMALVLLRFPNAPKEYRAGVYEAMREEQMHTLMYIRRMKACGIHFGELPLNDHFWKIVAPMETPMDFVTRLNLTFEQANLDFSKHYAALFRQAGDAATAAVLEKIHLDEIGHVGHGLKWFRKWKERGETDWHAYRRNISFPLTPARAKGVAPFNRASRLLAGLDEDFIRHVEVSGESRGRTPVLHWFNPNAEHHARALLRGTPYQPDKAALALETDLEALMFGICRKDDAILMRRPPSVEHLIALKRAGFDPPEIFPMESAPGRKLGGLRPWAWSPDASVLLEKFSADVSSRVEETWRTPLPGKWFSKEIGLELENMLGAVPETGKFLRSEEKISALLAESEALLKAPFSHAGRGHLRVNYKSDPAKTSGWIRNTLAAHGGVIVEPWLERVMDFSALYDGAKLLGMTRMENDAAGRFLGIRVARKWGDLLDREVAEFLFKEARVMEIYQEKIPRLLEKLLPGYHGALCVDAMVHQRQGKFFLKPVVELNVRITMGRLAWEWMRKANAASGFLRLLRKGRDPLPEHGSPLNDPAAAECFLAWWQ